MRDLLEELRGYVPFNEQEEKDRKRSEGDYKINLKSEIIIEDMHYKLDAIIARQGEILKYLSDKK